MAEVVAISLEVDSGNSVNEVKRLEIEVSNLIDETNDLRSINNDFKTELSQLTKEYEKMPKMALAGKKAIKIQMDELKNSIKDNNLALQDFRLKKQQKDKLISDIRLVRKQSEASIKAVGNIAKSVGTGYQAFLGVSALIGSENEDIMRSLQKLQGVQATLNALEKISIDLQKQSTFRKSLDNVATKVKTGLNWLLAGSIKVVNGALKSLRGALIATGLGALIVLIGTIIAKWDDWKDSIMKIINFAFAPFIKVLQYLGVIDSDLEKERKKNSEAYVKRLEKEREELDKNLTQEEGRLKREISLGKARGENTDKLEKELLKIRLRGSKDRLQNLKDSRREVSKQKKEGWLEEFNELGKQIDDEKEARANAKNEIEVFDANATKEQRDAWKKANEIKKADKKKFDEKTLEEAKEFDAEKLALQRELTDLIIASEKDEEVRLRAQLKIKQKREKEDLITKYGKDTLLLKELKKIQAQELLDLEVEIGKINKDKEDEDKEILKELNDEIALAEINTEAEKRQAEYNALDLHYQTLIDKAKKNHIDTTELQNSWNEEKAKKDKNFAQDDIKTAEDVANAKDLLINKRLGEAFALSNSMAQLFSKNEKMQKANALVQIGIDTATAVSALVSSSSQNPLNATTFGLAGAVHLTTGLVSIFGNIAKAKQLLMGGSGGGATGVTPPSISVPSTDTSTINSQSTNGDGSGGFNIPTNRVVLVESDLRMMQERRNNSDIISTI